MTPKHFYLELYSMNYYFFVGWEQRAFTEYLDLKYDITAQFSDYDSGATVFDEDTQNIFMWVRQADDMASTLCHESVHAASYTLNWANVYVSTKEDEALAFLAELIFMKAADKTLLPQ